MPFSVFTDCTAFTSLPVSSL
ncbi:MAG: hypothetical protein IJL25_02760 [Clostridia bacterium]|nr:hypothetical protein [Clostridia bacterium]